MHVYDCIDAEYHLVIHYSLPLTAVDNIAWVEAGLTSGQRLCQQSCKAYWVAWASCGGHYPAETKYCFPIAEMSTERHSCWWNTAKVLG